jgi:hypothetical protein
MLFVSEVPGANIGHHPRNGPCTLGPTGAKSPMDVSIGNHDTRGESGPGWPLSGLLLLLLGLLNGLEMS